MIAGEDDGSLALNSTSLSTACVVIWVHIGIHLGRNDLCGEARLIWIAGMATSGGSKKVKSLSDACLPAMCKAAAVPGVDQLRKAMRHKGERYNAYQPLAEELPGQFFECADSSQRLTGIVELCCPKEEYAHKSKITPRAV